MVYLIGSLAEIPRINALANTLRLEGHEVFDDWTAAGKEADRCWEAYEKQRGRTYAEALKGYAARHVFEFDRFHLDRCAVAVLVMPAGKSAHMELLHAIGQGKPGYILLDEEAKRYDAMHCFATDVFTTEAKLIETLETFVERVAA